MAKLTKEQGLIRITVNQAFNRRVMLFTEGIESQSRVVWEQRGPQRNKLAANGVVKRIVPVSYAERVRCDANGHWGNTNSLLDLTEKVIFSLDLGKRRVRITGSWKFLRKNAFQELKQLALSLDCILDLC